MAGLPGFRFIRADLRKLDASCLNAVTRFSPDYIVHLAAKPGVRGDPNDAQSYFDTNVGGTEAVARLSRDCRPRALINASSSSVFSAEFAMPYDEVIIPQGTPASVYGQTKKQAEAIIRDLEAKAGVVGVNLRFFTVYGPQGRPDMWVGQLLAAMREGSALTMFGEGSQARAFTYVTDVTEVLERIMTCFVELRSVGALAKPWNICAPHSHSLTEVIKLAKAITHRELTLKVEKPRLGELPNNRGIARSVARQWPNFRWTPLNIGLAALIEKDA